MFTVFITQYADEILSTKELNIDPDNFRDMKIELLDNPLSVDIELKSKKRKVTLYTRDQMMTCEDVYAKGSVPGTSIVDDNWEDDEFSPIVKKALWVHQNICQYLFDNGELEKAEDLEENTEGILITGVDDTIYLEYVSGLTRPDLPFDAGIFGGGITVGRPYPDEYMKNFNVNNMLEFMSFEKKIEAAKNGDVNMINEVAKAYLESCTNDEDDLEGAPADEKEAFYWMKKAAETGRRVAMFNMGLFYACSFGTDFDLHESCKWLTKAAQYGDCDAMKILEIVKAVINEEKAAENGDGNRQYELANTFLNLSDIFSKANIGSTYGLQKRALNWALKSAAQGNDEAYFFIGCAYANGRGVESDDEKAISYYKKGAELGNGGCKNNLALYYVVGNILERDENLAFSLFTQAAESGYDFALNNLGNCYENGLGVEKNIDKAIEYYEKFLENNDNQNVFIRLMYLKHRDDPDFNKDPVKFILSQLINDEDGIELK